MTTHKLINKSSSEMNLPKDSVQLVVTSPPYPMIQMWDDCFEEWAKNNPKLLSHNFKDLLNSNKLAQSAFENAHLCLDTVWQECDNALISGGIVCINIGDATRTINDSFQLFSNHSRIINWFLNHDYLVLPPIIWHKPTNAPNKFMGSGMYPCGAYVTYEHEYILIFRKNGKREYTDEQSKIRQESAYFYEERNEWFSEIWNIRGTSQKLLNDQAKRERNASYPFEIPYRLINMYSIKGDTVLDPFSGTGQTSMASLISERNSIGFDIDNKLIKTSMSNICHSLIGCCAVTSSRLSKHRDFIEDVETDYFNEYHKFKVKTKQEINLRINSPHKIYKENNVIHCEYFDKLAKQCY